MKCFANAIKINGKSREQKWHCVNNRRVPTRENTQVLTKQPECKQCLAQCKQSGTRTTKIIHKSILPPLVRISLILKEYNS